MPRRARSWSIWRRTFSRPISRRRKRCALSSRPKSTNGGRSSKRPESRRSERLRGLLVAGAEAAQHLGPERDFIPVEFVEIGGAAVRRRRHVVAEVGKALDHIGVAERHIERSA